MNIVDLYNLCIYYDSLLYPLSDYSRCFNKLNEIYNCKKIDIFKDNYEIDLVINLSLFSVQNTFYQTWHLIITMVR